MSRHGIAAVKITLTCNLGHETIWMQTDEHGGVGGGNAYCNGCDGETGTWRGITWDAYDDSREDAA